MRKPIVWGKLTAFANIILGETDQFSGLKISYYSAVRAIFTLQ